MQVFPVSSFLRNCVALVLPCTTGSTAIEGGGGGGGGRGRKREKGWGEIVREGKKEKS